MSNISKVVKAVWTQPSGKIGFQYDVYYESGRRVRYSWDKNLPRTVVGYILKAGECETRYEKRYKDTIKFETYKC